MNNPTDIPKLSQLAEGPKKAVIIIRDNTHPVTSRNILTHILKEQRRVSSDIDVTLLVTAGFHRLTTKAETRFEIGEEIENSEN